MSYSSDDENNIVMLVSVNNLDARLIFDFGVS